MKAFCFFLFSFLFLIVSVSAQAQDHNRPSLNVSTAFWSQYLGDFGIRLSDDKHGRPKPVIQSDATLSWMGFRANVWNSKTLDGKADSAGNETDLTVGWRGTPLPGKILSPVSLDVGMSVFFLPNDNRTLEPFAQIGYDFRLGDRNVITPFARVEINFPNKGNDQTTRGFWGIGHQLKILRWLKLRHSLAVVADSGMKPHLDPSLLYRAVLKVELTDDFSLDLKAKITGPINGRADSRRLETAFGAGFSYTF